MTMDSVTWISVKDNVLATQYEAVEDCKSKGADLLTVETQSELVSETHFIG